MTVMNESFESDERKRKEIIECLYWSLMNGWDIPKDIREHYGFSEDYELYHQLERLETIVREAVQQSGSAVPELIGPLPFAKALPLLEGTRIILHQSRRTATVPIAKAISGASCVSYMIGPEGGFSDRECESAEHEAALPVLLPTNILRAETAAVYAASAIQTLLNEPS